MSNATTLKRPALEPITEDLIRGVTETIVREYQPDKIILFGSYVWGQPEWDSDLDLFIVKDSPLPPHRRATEVSDLFLHRRFAMDILVYTPQEVEERLRLRDFFVRRILTQGRGLYDRIQSNPGP